MLRQTVSPLFGTFATYVAARFMRTFLAFLIGATALIFLFDFLELLRRASSKSELSLNMVALISVMRVPKLIEQTIPFVILLGSIFALLTLNRRLELVVARGSGISAWQFLMPGLVTTFVFGVLFVALFNPIAVYLKDRSDTLGLELFGKQQLLINQSTSETWLRQRDEAGLESIIHAGYALANGRQVFDVTLFTIDSDGVFSQRLEARRGELKDGHWLLDDVVEFSSDGTLTKQDRVKLATTLSPALIQERFSRPENVSFWSLNRLITNAKLFGLPAYRYAYQFHSLLALPLLLCAMVLIGASVSLSVYRTGANIMSIFGGIGAGFVLYVSVIVAKDVGGAGLVSPAIAAWVPSIAATLVGLTVLLHKEDG